MQYRDAEPPCAWCEDSAVNLAVIDMDHDIKRRMLHEAVQDNLASAMGASVVPSATAVHPNASPPRTLWALVVSMVYLAVVLLVVPTGDISTAISTVRALPGATPRPVPIASQQPAILPWVDAQDNVPIHDALVWESLTLPEEGIQEPEAAEPAALTFATPKRIDLTTFSLDIKTIVVDPGHGGKDTGTSIPSGLTEKELTLDIGLRLSQLLKQDGFEVLLTRTTDQSVPLRQRSALANAQHADLFVSIHLNWMERSQARGIETYYLGPTEDPDLLQLAAQENRDSGYSLADFRRFLDQIYLSVRREESQRLAEAVQRTLVTTLSPHNPARVNRGVKTAPFAVLVGTEMPAILAEVACLSNAKEARLLATSQYRQDIARALAHGILAYTQARNRSPKLSQKGN